MPPRPRVLLGVAAAVLLGATALAAAYEPPKPLPAAQLAKQYPDGDRATAKKHNAEGLALRKIGDGAGAMAAYKAAVATSPSYVPGHYNYACELAIAGQLDAAVAQLEHLLRIGTLEARSFAARAAFDEDFLRLRDDPRFLAIAASFTVDPSRPFLAQVCADESRLAAVVDAERGFGHYLETESAVDEALARKATGALRPATALRFLRKMMGPEGLWCEGRAPRKRSEDCEAALADFALSEGPACFVRLGCTEWSDQEELCVVSAGGSWRVAFAARRPDGPLAPEFRVATEKALGVERTKALAAFGQTAPVPTR
jgi:tetratricopeptide (TPR) repeat protein